MGKSDNNTILCLPRADTGKARLIRLALPRETLHATPMKPLPATVRALLVSALITSARADQPITQLSDLPDFFRERAVTWGQRNIDSDGPERAAAAWFQVEKLLSDHPYWAAAFGLTLTSSWIEQHRFAGIVRASTVGPGVAKSSIFVLSGFGRGTTVEFSRVEPKSSFGLPINLPVLGVLDDAGSVVCVLFPGSTEFVNLGGDINVVFDPAYDSYVVQDYGGVTSLTELSEIMTHVDDIYLNASENFLALHRVGMGYVGSIEWEGVWTNRHGGAGGPDPDETSFNPSVAIRKSKDDFHRWARAFGTPGTIGERNGWLSPNVWNWDVREGQWAGITIDKRASHVGATSLAGRMFRVYRVASDDSLNMRTEPSSEARIVKKLPSTATGIRMISSAAVHNDDGDWAFVSHADLLGWVKFIFLQPEPRN